MNLGGNLGVRVPEISHPIRLGRIETVEVSRNGVRQARRGCNVLVERILRRGPGLHEGRRQGTQENHGQADSGGRQSHLKPAHTCSGGVSPRLNPSESRYKHSELPYKTASHAATRRCVESHLSRCG